MKGVNYKLLLGWGWVAIVAVISSFGVFAIGWWVRIPLPNGVKGIAVLGTILGTIAVLGGLITTITGLFTLSSLEDRVVSATRNEDARRTRDLDERWDKYTDALERYWTSLNEPDVKRAGKFWRKHMKRLVVNCLPPVVKWLRGFGRTLNYGLGMRWTL